MSFTQQYFCGVEREGADSLVVGARSPAQRTYWWNKSWSTEWWTPRTISVLVDRSVNCEMRVFVCCLSHDRWNVRSLFQVHIVDTVCCTRYFLSGLVVPASLARGAESPTSLYWSSRIVHSVPNFILIPSLLISTKFDGRGSNLRHLILIIQGSLLRYLRLVWRIRPSARAWRLGAAGRA